MYYQRMRQEVGKREFAMHISKYLSYVEKTGKELTITHQNHPTLKLIPLKKRQLHDLKGTLAYCKVKGDINDPILPGFDQW